MPLTGRDTATLDERKLRSRALRLAAVVVCMIIVGRLGWLQLIRGEFYRNLSEDNYVQGFEVRAPRGLILDRHGEILADNRASLSVTISRLNRRDDLSVAVLLSRLLDVDEAYVAEKLEEASGRFYGNVVLVADADFEQIARVEEHRSELPGVKVEVAAVRRYLYDALATHGIGYVGEVSDAELPSMGPLGYGAGDVVGRTGAEQRYELVLRGRDGAEYWVCDAVGHELYPFEGGPSREVRPGHSLMLTLDLDAQRAAEEALTRHDGGSVVAIEPSTGEILVLASQPAPNPNEIVDGITEVEWQALTGSDGHPLLNRSIQATYPPGSPFKLITVGAGLETGLANHHDTITCTGAYKYGIRTFRCWKREGHGVVDVMKGVVESCDVYFYQLGARLGVAQLMDWAERAGIGRRTGIDIAGEVSGNVPTPSWYDRIYGARRWSRGVVLNLAIGQGELLVTPLQMACIVCGIANEGPVHAPHILKRVETYSGRVLGTARTTTAYEIPFSRSTFSFIKESMVNVVEASNGTGKLARVPGIKVAGKTGTAQNPHGEDHAWFVSYAPADDPQIVVAVLIEHGGGGGAIAAPIAAEVIRAYLGIKPPEPKPARPVAAAVGDNPLTAAGSEAGMMTPVDPDDRNHGTAEDTGPGDGRADE